MSRVLLGTYEHGIYFGIKDRIIKRTYSDSGISEDNFYIFFFKAFNQGFSAVHIANLP